MIRRAWSRLIRKQWLILYPVGLAIINTLAFLAVYAASDGPLGWSAFFSANFERETYLHDHFFHGLDFTSSLAIAVFAGIAVCAFSALLRAPLFHAIAGSGYPLSPRKWGEAGRLFSFYLLYYLVLWLAPLALPTDSVWVQVAYPLVIVIAILIAFADYAVVFEELGPIRAVRRSIRLLRHAWGLVLGVVVVFWFIQLGLNTLYSHYYDDDATIFIVLPVAQVLLNSFVSLVVDLLLIFIYENTRRDSPAA